MVQAGAAWLTNMPTFTHHSSSEGVTRPVALPEYVLITPARNEAAVIKVTLESVVRQTILPLKWVIVSDGSTDGTDEIVKQYTAAYPWIELVRMPQRKERNFAGKVLAFNAGYERVRTLPYKFLACLDSDISFEPDYFDYLIAKASSDPRLGIIGTAFREPNMSYDYRFVSIEHVSGPCQFFRRECFEDIGGYLPVRGGGVDHIAVLTARMRGWKTRCFTEKFYHHRDMGSAKHGPLGYKLAVGRLDYALGSHPLWEASRVVYQITKRPRVLGGMMIGIGYLAAALVRTKRPISRELVRFRRREQITRLRQQLIRLLQTTMNTTQKLLRITQSALKSYGPSSLKRILWDKEYSGDKWNFADHTEDDCVYSHLEQYAAAGSILDLGCGSGNTANELDPDAYKSYVGVDISEVCLRKARRRSAENGRADKNKFVRGDLLTYTPTQRFDVILFRESLYHVPIGKVGATLRRYAKYLSNGGVFVVRMGTSDVNGNPKSRPMAMIGVIEREFDLVENSHYRESGATVVVFRPR